MANGRCKMHRGKAAKGTFAPNYKHGLYSKYLPARFGELLAALEGRDLLDLTDDIKLLHARLLDIAKQVEAGESGERWKEAQKQFEQFAACQAQQDREGALMALTELRNTLRAGVAEWAAWEKIEELVVKKTKVVESQRKRAVETHEMLAAQEVRLMMRALTMALRTVIEQLVTDRDLKGKLLTGASTEFARLVGAGYSSVAPSRDQ